MGNFNSLGIFQFNSLSLKEKYEAVIFVGICLTTIFKQDYKYSVYSLSFFWVEIKYQKINNKLISVDAFIYGDILNKYSPDISFINS